MSSLERLEQFLRDAFSVDEVRGLWSSYNREQGRLLPGEPASLVAVVGAGVDLLRRYRPDEKFFTLLRDSRPNRSREIDALERSLIAPVESTPGRLFLASRALRPSSLPSRAPGRTLRHAHASLRAQDCAKIPDRGLRRSSPGRSVLTPQIPALNRLSAITIESSQ